jgi:hypothetical protein
MPTGHRPPSGCVAAPRNPPRLIGKKTPITRNSPKQHPAQINKRRAEANV